MIHDSLVARFDSILTDSPINLRIQMLHKGNRIQSSDLLTGETRKEDTKVNPMNRIPIAYLLPVFPYTKTDKKWFILTDKGVEFKYGPN
jgi:hypothetical protein